ncbi:Transcription factor [Neofusicoccum parvum]|nr:Transcription factor [Neofusicoccum parvum]
MQDITYPSVELLYWMLRELRSGKIGLHAVHLLQYLSPQTLERMGVALVEQDGDQETLLLYSICVNFRTAQFLNMTVLEETDGAIAQKLRLAAEKYLCSAEIALSRIHLLTPPSAALLQAQLCGASISRAAGNLAACWTFTSAACKTCMDLRLKASLEKEDDELYYCFVYCYILDKGFSMILGRRPYLSGSELISSKHPVWTSGCSTLNLMTVHLEIARIQGVIASDLHCRARPKNNLEQRYKVSLVANLLLQMDGLRKKVDTFDRTPSDFRGLYMDRELHILDFAFYSALTAIRRFESLNLTESSSISKDCVEAARMSILSLRYLQGHQSADANNAARLSFVNW